MMTRIFRSMITVICLVAIGQAAASDATAALPGDSLFRLDVPLTTHRGSKLELTSLAGKPALITMFYGNCQLACPVTLHSVASIVKALPADKRSQLTVLLISLDPKNDNADSLAMLGKEHQMSDVPYLFAVADSDRDTRTMAAALGIRYRRLSNGEINHSARLVVTDPQGNVLMTSEDIRPGGAPGVIDKLAKQLR